MSIAITEPIEDTAVETVECAECLEQVEETAEVKSGSEVCEDCRDAHYTFCEDCNEYTPDGDVRYVDRGSYQVCDDCIDNYTACYRCEEYVPDADTYLVYSDDLVCNSCLDWYHWCDYCDMRVDSDDDEHYHDGDDSTDCCESPYQSQTFTMPNGAANDERFGVTMPDGIISEAGMAEIRMMIFDALRDNYDLRYQVSSAVYSVGNEYVSKDGKYTKRIAKWLHQNYKAKVSDDLLSKIGQTAQKASVGGTLNVEFTRQLNLSAYEFYHEGSCWWSEYSYSRCTLKSNGGVGMRTFDEDGNVSGRAWIFPLRKDEESGRLVPTFDTATADAMVVFNGYGELAENAQARALAGIVEGWVSKRVSFDPGNMYVNAGGFLVGPAEIVEAAGQSLGIYMERHTDLFDREQADKNEAAA